MTSNKDNLITANCDKISKSEHIISECNQNLQHGVLGKENEVIWGTKVKGNLERIATMNINVTNDSHLRSLQELAII